MADAYKLNADGTKSSVKITVEGSGNNSYIKGVEREPFYINDTIVYVKKYFETVASQVVEVAGENGRVFITPAQKTSLDTLVSNKLERLGNETIPGNNIGRFFYVDDTAAMTHYLATEDFVTNITDGLSSGLTTLQAYFDSADDADDVINKWHEIEAFLSVITEESTLTGLISSVVCALKTGNNGWTGNNTFKSPLKVALTTTTNPVKIEFDKGTYGSLSLEYSGQDGGGTRKAILVGALSTITNPTLAYTYQIPTLTISATAPSNPKAGDVWFDIST